MFSALIFLTLMAAATPSTEYLVSIDADYRDISDEAWLDEADVLEIGRDYLVVKVDGAALGALPAHTILDRGDLDANVYLSVEFLSETGRENGARLGKVLLEDSEHLLIRQEGEPPADFRMDGIRAVVPLRVLTLAEEQAPPSTIRPPEGLIEDIVGAVSEASYQGHIQDLEDFVTRNARHANFPSACTFVHDRFESYGIDAEVEEFIADPWFGGPFTCWNVIAEKPGVVYPDSIYIICGHLDSTAGNPSTPESVAPGADDNASGTSAALEAARIMGTYDFKYTLRFIGFGAEEQGLCGSDVYAAAAGAAGEYIRGVLNLDMVLYGPPGYETLRVIYNGNSLPIAEAFGAAAATYVPALDVDLIYNPGSRGSDHYSFWVVGYRAVEVIELNLSGNPHYHTTHDQLANYLQFFPFGTNCVRAAIATLATLAEPLAPTGVTATEGAPGIDRLAISSVTPNPVRDVASITLSSALEQPVSLTIFDIYGRALRQETVESRPAGTFDVRFGFGDLPSGIYLVRAQGIASAAQQKIVITR